MCRKVETTSYLKYCFENVQSLKEKRRRQNTGAHIEIFKLRKGSQKTVKAMKMSGSKIRVYLFIKGKIN
jgi:hypothetical protein